MLEDVWGKSKPIYLGLVKKQSELFHARLDFCFVGANPALPVGCEWPCCAFPECAGHNDVSQGALFPVSLAWDRGLVSNRGRTEPWTPYTHQAEDGEPDITLAVTGDLLLWVFGSRKLRGTLLWAGLPNLWMRRGLDGCLVLKKGCSYIFLVVSLKGMRKKLFFFPLQLALWKCWFDTYVINDLLAKKHYD